jgi:hypothetical protein
MNFLQSNWIIAFVCTVTYYNAGKFEARSGARDHGVLWAGLSIAISALVIQIFGGSWLFVLVAQAGLFVGIGVFRALRNS